MFMDQDSIQECVTTMKIKNGEGMDRIPQRILVDGLDRLMITFSGLFRRIYEQVTIPGQWLASKTIPVYKNKGDERDITNYRPISRKENKLQVGLNST